MSGALKVCLGILLRLLRIWACRALLLSLGSPQSVTGPAARGAHVTRESTLRIAEGEDPDDVNESLSAPPGANRQARRLANKKKAKAAKKKKNKM